MKTISLEQRNDGSKETTSLFLYDSIFYFIYYMTPQASRTESDCIQLE